MYHINKEITGSEENIALKNTAKHYFKDFNILGNSKQETREGYNKAKYTSDSTDANFNIGDIETGKTYSLYIKVNGYVSFNLKYGSTGSTIATKYNVTGERVYKIKSTQNAVLHFNGFTAESGAFVSVNNIMLLEGEYTLETLPPYEQYGASPSIEYEAPIESVGDNINLFDGIFNKHDIANDTGIEQSFESENHLLTANYIEVKPNTDYTLSFDHIFSANTGITKIMEFDKDHNFIIRNSASSKANTITFKTSENCKYIRVGIFDAGGISETKLKISKGTKATPYSPYGQGSVEICKCNKNFFNKDNIREKHRLDDKGLDYYQVDYFVSDYIPVKEKTKYVKNTLISTMQAVSYYDKDKNHIKRNTTENPFTTPEGTCYIRTGDLLTNLDTLQVEEGSLSTEYAPHQSQTKALYTQQPFRAIGDVRDKFVKVDGANKEQHHIKRIIADGVNYLVGYVFPTGYAILKDSTKTNIVAKAVKDWAKKGNILCNKLETVSQADIQQRSYGGVAINNEGYVMIKLDDSAEENVWTTESINNFLSENPLTIDYELATPTLIECTPEQVEQLEEIEKEMYSYDEVTNIYSTDKISPYFDVIAYQRISEEFKTRLKEGKITRGYLKVLATDTLPEIIINENNYLKDLKIEELRYVPEEGIIGGTVAKRVSGNFNNVDSSFDIQDREIEVYLGVELEDETTEYIKYGTYIVQRPEDDQVNDNTSFEALDYMIKFNQEYKDRITYPCTLKQLLDDIIDQAGVNSKVATFANSDFVVENNQFEQGSTLRDVLKAITQVAFNWSRIDADDNLVMDFEIREETDEELGTDDYFSFKKSDDYGPVNVVVLRNSQVEGENVTIKDDKLINEPIGYNLFNFSTITRSENLINNNDGTFSSKNSKNNVIINCAANSVPYDDFSLPLGEYYIYMKIKTTLAVTLTNFFICTQNNNGVSQNIQKPLNITLPVNTETIIKTNVTLSEDKPKVGFVAYFDAITDFTVSDIMVSKSKEEKPYQPYIPIGEIEYVISDNPFAYTELKRKQLIEAGRRLFGFKYTPMTVDMLGLMYLNSKDRITVENLNGQKYSTYLFDHTIDYTGIVLDSMESKAKSKTETKYQYVSSLAQGLSHVEIKVDKANKRIESIIESQEDVSEKVAKTVARIEVVYASSDSPTEAPTDDDDWDTKAPPWENGKYMWQKTITTYANGSTAETAPTNISGAQGKDGVSGNNSYSYVAFANSADGSVDFSRADSTDKTYIGTLTINESVNENLLRNTNKGTTNWGFATQNGVVSKEQYTEEGKNAVKLTCTTASTGWQYASYSIGTEILKRLKENTNYILSFDIKTNIGPSTLEVAIKKGDSTNAIAQGVKADILGDETWEHFSVQLKTISDFSNITIGGQVVYFIGMNKVGYYIIENLKLEEGYRETSYSKSPEDLANDYTQYNWQYTKGEQGIGVSDVVDQYYSSTSNTEVTGGEWKETQDTLKTDRFIWTRSKITWTNGSVTYTDPILAATLNNINSNIIVFKEFTTTQIIENGKIIDRVTETTKKLNNDYSTTEQVDSKVDKVKEDVAILAQKFVDVERTAEEYVIKINEIDNNGVDKIKTRMGYTFNDEGLKIDRPGADTSTIIDEAKIKVTDKTGSEPKSLLYAGYVKEGDTEFSDYEGQTIVATSNLIVQNFLIIGSNSRFQDYYNETLDGNGTGAFDI